jgi:hypothetical protein
MDDAARAQEMWSQFTGKNLAALTVWAEAHQRILKEWVDFTSTTAKEGVRLYGEMQSKALDGVKTLVDGTYGPQAAWRVTEENMQTLTRTAERVQVTAEQAGKGIQATLTDAVNRTKEIYAAAA